MTPAATQNLARLASSSLEGLELCFEVVFPFRELAEQIFGFGGPRTQRLLVAHTVERPYQIFPGADGFPVESASELLVFLTKVEEVLIELDSIDRYPPLLDGFPLKTYFVLI